MHQRKRDGHRRDQQRLDKLFGPLPQSEDDEVLVGGDIIVNHPPPERQERPSLLRRMVPYLATAVLAGVGGAYAPAAIGLLDGALNGRDEPAEQHVHTDTDTDTIGILRPDRD